MEKHIAEAIVFNDIIATLATNGDIKQWDGIGIGKIQEEVSKAIATHEGCCDFEDYTGEYGTFKSLLIADGLGFGVSHNADKVFVYKFTHKANFYKIVYKENGFAKICSGFITNGEIWNHSGAIYNITTINADNSIERYEQNFSQEKYNK